MPRSIDRDRNGHVTISRFLESTAGVSIHATLDTAVWDGACERMLANGLEVASAPPIQD